MAKKQSKAGSKKQMRSKMIRNITAFALTVFFFSCHGQTVKEIKFGKYTEPIKVLKPEEFNIEGTWEIVHREWILDCQKKKSVGDTIDFFSKALTKHDLHIGDQVEFTDSFVVSYSSMLNLFYPYIRFRKGYWSIDEFQKFEQGYDCKGDYFKETFGDKLSFFELRCKAYPDPIVIDTVKNELTPSYTIPKEGRPTKLFFILNENTILYPEGWSIVYLKRTNKKAGFASDKEGNKIITGSRRDENFSIFLPEILKDASSEKMLRIEIVDGIKSVKDSYFYEQYYCENYDPKAKYKWLYPEFVYTGNSKKRVHYIKIPNTHVPTVDLGLEVINANEAWKLKYKVYPVISKTVLTPKAILFNYDSNKGLKNSGQYLIKEDKVNVLDEDGGMYFVEFRGAKVVRGWIKKSDVK